MSGGRLGDYVDFLYGKSLPARSRRTGAVPVFGSAGRVGSHDQALVKGPGVIVGRKGTVGAVHWSDDDFFPIDTTFYVVPKNEQELRRRYAYYLLSTLSLRNMNTDSAVPGLNRSHALSLQVAIAPPGKQDAIIKVLSAYDRLIDNNRRRMRLLERAARLLYKEWFVRFRFPGHEKVSVVNLLPAGWRTVRLSDVAHITMGQSPSSTHYNDAGVGLPFHQGVSDFGQRFTADRMYCTVQNRLARPGDILFSVRAPVGRINLTIRPIVIGRGIAAIRSLTSDQSYLFYALKTQFFKEDMMGTGTIFAAITKKDLHDVELVYPPARILKLFAANVGPIDRQIETLQRSNELLQQARDALLPRLMSGRIAV